MAALPESAVELIESGAHGHLVTIGADGSMQPSLVRVGVEGGELVIGYLADQIELRNVRRDPRLSVSFESTDTDRTGLAYYLVVAGEGRVSEGGAPELLQRLARAYLGSEVLLRPLLDDPPPGWVLRIAPTRVRGYGPWTAS